MDDNCGEWVEYMGVASGCGCKEVYRFSHSTYPYSSCICSFYSSIPTFCSFLKCFSFFKNYNCPKKQGGGELKRAITRTAFVFSHEVAFTILQCASNVCVHNNSHIIYIYIPHIPAITCTIVMVFLDCILTSDF